MVATEYEQFLSAKAVSDPPTGIEVSGELNPMLFDFQRDLVRWALRRGRAAMFADCGMGKTPMQLTWAHHVPGPVLIFAPLAVAAQTVREGHKFGIDVTYVREQPAELGTGVFITNYEMLSHFDLTRWSGVVLDESSILKSYMGKTKRDLVTRCQGVRFRLACTATPSPNDHMELGNHSEWLGVMPSTEMLARWFINDSMHAGAYRLKKHGQRDFWRWVASWAASLSKPSDYGDYDDSGFILPDLSVETVTVPSAPPPGELFHTQAALSATEIHVVKRETAESRAERAAAFVNAEPDAQCLVWCDTNYEADALKALMPDAVDVRGSDSMASKERDLLAFANGDVRVLITKPTVAGYGMNFQNCYRVVFVGLSYSFEQLYQAVRRVWRFGQDRTVSCLIVEAEAEVGIRNVVERKMRDHEQLKREMTDAMREFQGGRRVLTDAPEPSKTSGDEWDMWHGDCVEVTKLLDSDSIDFSVFSPPFANLYIYSESLADMGNSMDHEEFFTHFRYLISELLRVTVNGRLCAVHCKDLPSYMGRDGAAGLIDFPGMTIRAFEDEGWQYHSRVTIWKDPVTEMQRTKNHGLLHKQLCRDSAASRQGMADYLVVFRKWDGPEFPRPVHGPDERVRFPIDDGYVGENGPERVRNDRDHSIQVWQRYASPVWFDIKQTNVLSTRTRDEEDEKHICPLQLDVIRRAIRLWTNRGDLVLSPFAGIGSEGYVAIEEERRFVGVELKESYYRQALKNLQAAAASRLDLFSSAGVSA